MAAINRLGSNRRMLSAAHMHDNGIKRVPTNDKVTNIILLVRSYTKVCWQSKKLQLCLSVIKSNCFKKGICYKMGLLSYYRKGRLSCPPYILSICRNTCKVQPKTFPPYLPYSNTYITAVHDRMLKKELKMQKTVIRRDALNTNWYM